MNKNKRLHNNCVKYKFNSNNELFVLVYMKKNNGKKVYRKIVELFESDMRRLNDMCFEQEDLHEMSDATFFCAVFTQSRKVHFKVRFKLRFMMNFYDEGDGDTMIYDVCKMWNRRNVFKDALNFCLKHCPVNKHRLFLEVLTVNPALCVYIKSGFVPVRIQNDSILMKFSK